MHPTDTVFGAVQRAVRYLLENQNSDGSIAAGGDGRFKVWETAISLTALQAAGPTFDMEASRAASFLLSVRRSNGSFIHSARPALLHDRANYCIETTAVAACALARAGQPWEASLAFLLDSQLADGSWDIGIRGVRQEVRRFPSVTGFALRAALALGARGAAIERSVRYLSEMRSADGLWGSIEEAYDTPYYPAFVILEALERAGAGQGPVFRQAARTIKYQQRSDGSWGEVIPHRPSPALRTALALSGLLVSPVAGDVPAIDRAVGWLLGHQDRSGAWDGGYFGVHEPDKREDIFATGVAISALAAYAAHRERLVEAGPAGAPERGVRRGGPQARPTEAHYDVVVVGAGPAGIAFTRCLANQGSSARVLLLEKGRHPRDKVCGDALTSLSVPLVREIFPELSGAIPTQSFTRRYRFYFPNGKYVCGEDRQLDVMPRRDFDALLFGAVREEGIDIREGTTAVGLHVEGGRVTGVRAMHEGETFDIEADWVVGADGSAGIVRRCARGRSGRSAGVAVRQYVRGIPESADGLIFHVDPECGGYFWIFPFLAVGEHWANVGYFAPTGRGIDVRMRFEELRRSPMVERQLGTGELQGKAVGFPLNLARSSRMGIALDGPVWGPGYLLLGDAAGLIHPHTAEGIAAALYSGKVAAALYCAGLTEPDRGAQYEREVLEFAQSNYAPAGLFSVFRLPALLPSPLRELYMNVLPWWRKRRHTQSAPEPRDHLSSRDLGGTLDYWLLRTELGSVARIEHQDGAGRVRVAISAAATRAAWAIQLNRRGLTTRAGAHYCVSLRARSDAPRLISVGVARDVEAWDGLGLYSEVSLGPAWSQFDLAFQATADCDRARLHLDIGMSTAAVEVEGVAVRGVPSEGPRAKGGE